MALFRYRLVNVFATVPMLGPSALSGNPLCVFEDAQGLGLREMMALTRQFNLSETTFLLPSSAASTKAGAPALEPPDPTTRAPGRAPANPTARARLRIFTPTRDPSLAEMPFAGHPTLGSAHVLRSLAGGGDSVTLELPAGAVPVQASGDVWTLTAPFKGRPVARPEPMPPAQLAAMVGLEVDDLVGPPVWMDTGVEQLLVPVGTPAAVRKAAPLTGGSESWPRSLSGRCNAYIFAFSNAVVDGREQVAARFFINAPGSGLYEDPGTGSACANLGGWLLHTGRRLPASVEVSQGIEIERPCRLLLDVRTDGSVRVGGKVVEVATGAVTLPEA